MDAPATLADNLLEDLDDLDDFDDESGDEEKQQDDQGAKGADVSMKEESQENGEFDGSKAEEDNRESKTGREGFMGGRKRYLENAKLQQHLLVIRDMKHEHGLLSGQGDMDTKMPAKESIKQEDSNGKNGKAAAGVDDYPLIVQSNQHLAELENELAHAHAYLCELYHVKFPELEELLPDPIQYKDAVQVIKNTMDLTLVNDALNEVLASSNQVITISVAGSTTNGRLLTSDELSKIDAVISYIDEIIKVQRTLRQYVQARMNDLAPNICALLGSSALAAQILGLAGGLVQLSQIPACNLQVLGQSKQTTASRAGLSKVSTKPHQGLLIQCDLVQQYCPKPLQGKALKTVAAKLALAARCDRINVETGRPRSAASGQKFRQEILQKVEQWQEPDKAPVLKALPKPDLTVKKRRGGKRMRRLKERFSESALMKQANTRAFSSATGEYGDDAMGRTRGLLDAADITSGSANLRTTTAKRPMRLANTKASRQKAAQMQAQASKPTNGLASSVVFTPVQGMELVNPDANKDRVTQANEKWFKGNAGFMSALPKK